MKLTPILQLPNVVTGRWRRLGVHVFEGAISLDDIDKIDASGTEWNRKNPGKVVELAIIFPSDARMGSEVRARMTALVKHWESSRTASATVVLAQGLSGSMHRSVLTGFQMLAPPPHPTKVFGGIPEAVLWLTPHVQALCGFETTQAELLEAVGALCAAFRRPAQSASAASVNAVPAGSAGFARRDEARPRPGR